VKLQTRGADTPRSPRSGFTLLEVLLASLIAMLLLAALYFAMQVTLRQTQESRDSVDIENLSRGVFTRINLDLSASLAPLPPKSGGNSATSGSSGSSTTATTITSAAAMIPAGAGTTSADAGAVVAALTGGTDPTAAAAPQAADIGFQSGILGTDKQLTVFASRLPGTLTSSAGLSLPSDPSAQSPSDLVRITYWLNQNGGAGLCRQERPWVTADGVRDSVDPDLTTETTDVLVQEVTDLTFAYFDGQDWQSSWNPDGTATSPDGVTPLGPPRAVKVTLTLSIPGPRASDAPYVTTVEQVIAVRAAPGTNTPAMIVPSTDPGTSANSDPTAAASTPAASSTTGAGAAGGAGGAVGGAGAAGAKSTGGATAAPSTGGAKSGGGAMPSTSMPAAGGARGGGK
jgi:Tfp pilus assembly protein PilV